MEKIKVNQIVVVEGKYDAIKLDSIIDGLIIPVNGFSVFSDHLNPVCHVRRYFYRYAAV